MSEIELKPCPFCGSTDIAMWGGFGTQADIYCNDCCCERNVQVVDLCDNERPKFDEKTCRYPDWLVTRANEHLIEEWNTRAAQQDGVREDKLGMLRDTLERLVMHRKGTPGLHYDNEEQLLVSAISHAETAIHEIDALRGLEQTHRRTNEAT